jgi:Uma2 family endonuclease
MAAHPKQVIMTVEKYYDLPDRDDVVLELHWGRPVELSRPKCWQVKLQQHIAKLLETRSRPDWSVVIGLPFRALSQFDLRTADVGVIAKSRWDAVGEGDLFGSPEIMIEIVTPSNRRGEIADRMALFLATGTQQFCEIDDTRRIVTVTGLDNQNLVYRSVDEVPFPLLGASIKVSEIWEED